MTESRESKPPLNKITDVLQELEQHLPFLSAADSEMFYNYSLKIGKNILSAKSRGHFPEKIDDFQKALLAVQKAQSLLGEKESFLPSSHRRQLAHDLDKLKGSLEKILDLLASAG